MYNPSDETAIMAMPVSAEAGELDGLVKDRDYPEVQPIRCEEAPKASCNDAWAAGLFIVNVLVVLGFAIHNGATAMQSHPSGDASSAAFTPSDVQALLRITLLIIVIAACLSAVWMVLMVRAGKELINLSIGLSVVMCAILCVISFAMKSIIFAGFYLLLGAITACYYFVVQRRVPFAAANLGVATKAVTHNCGVVCVAFLCMVLQFAWLMLWSLAVLGLYKQHVDGKNSGKDCAKDDQECKMGPPGAAFLLLISLYWGQELVRNISHATTAGSVASWWFMSSGSQHSGTSSALRRSLTTSFGSICLGSLLVAIVRALREIAREARKKGKGNGALLCIAEMVLGCLEEIAKWLTMWAYVYVAIYGMDLRTAGTKVVELFQCRGWSMIINDDLIRNVLSLGSLVVGALSAGAAVAWASAESFSSSEMQTASLPVAGVLGFIVGASMCSVIMTVIDSAVCTIYVCFAEDPGALRTTHPAAHHELMSAWSVMYPQEMMSCGYVSGAAAC
jgi:hypothetical protein